LEDATRNGQAPTAGTVELDTAPRPVVATVPQASRAARKSAQQVRIVATGENLLSAPLPDLTPARRAERRARLCTAFRAAVDCALERRAQLFFIAGNLFASPAPENADRTFVAQELARLHEAGVTCVAVAGPRDVGGDASDVAPYRLYESSADLRFFPPGEAMQPALVVIDGVRVALAGSSAAPNANLFEQARFDDPDDVLGRADLAILILPEQVEGVRAAAGGSISASSLAALPSVFHLVIAGGAPQFGKVKVGKREAVAPGASERHSFDTPAESAGFAWIEMNAEGVTLAEHVRIEEQPRVEVEIATKRLFPHGDVEDEADDEKYARSGAHLLPVLTPEELMAADTDGDDVVTPYTPPPPDAERERVLKRILDALQGACRPDTMARARLTGPLTRRQFHRLPLAETLRYGRQEAFSFELDTSGLVIESEHTDTTPGPVSLNDEIDRLVAEYRARLREDEREARADVDKAAGLLRARLQAANSTDREAAR
jgi:DNA repair exonuclease SbcCD nuclease subunit